MLELPRWIYISNFPSLAYSCNVVCSVVSTRLLYVVSQQILCYWHHPQNFTSLTDGCTCMSVYYWINSCACTFILLMQGSLSSNVGEQCLLLLSEKGLGLLQGKSAAVWVIHMDSHPFLIPFICIHLYVQSISGCLSYCGKTKIQTDQLNPSYTQI